METEKVDEITEETTTNKTKGCGVVQGTTRHEGDTWQKDVCTQCSCKVSDFVLVAHYLNVVV